MGTSCETNNTQSSQNHPEAVTYQCVRDNQYINSTANWQHRRRTCTAVPILYNGPPFPLKIARSHRGTWTPSNTRFLGPTRVLNSNSISISSALFAGLTSVTDRQTDHDTRSVAIGRIYVRSTAMQTNNQLECGPMPNVMVALLNIGGAVCLTPQSLARAHCSSAMQSCCQYRRVQGFEDTK